MRNGFCVFEAFGIGANRSYSILKSYAILSLIVRLNKSEIRIYRVIALLRTQCLIYLFTVRCVLQNRIQHFDGQ